MADETVLVGVRAVREAAALQEGAETSIVPERIPLWIDRQKNDMDVAGLVAALEPLQGLIVLTKA